MSTLTRLIRDNPVFTRELSAAVRQRGFIVAVAVILLVAAGAGWLSFEDAYGPGRLSRWGGGDAMGRVMIATLLSILVIAHALAVPFMTVPAIVSEREGRTLDVLLLTGQSPRAIVLGKMLSVLCLVGIGTAALLPALGFPALFGDVGVLELLGFGALLVVHAVTLSAVGIAASAQASTVKQANGLLFLLLLAGVWVPLSGPLFASTIAYWVDRGVDSLLLVFLVGGLVLAAAVTLRAVAIAERALLPRQSHPRFGLVVSTGLAVLGLPVVVAGATLVASPKEGALLPALLAFVVGAVVCLVDAVGNHAVPRRRALAVSAAFVVGSLLLPLGLSGDQRALDPGWGSFDSAFVVVHGAAIAFWSMLIATSALPRRSLSVRAGALLVLVVVLYFAIPVLDDVSRFGTDLPLAMLCPTLVLQNGPTDVAIVTALYLVGAGLLSLRGRRR